MTQIKLSVLVEDSFLSKFDEIVEKIKAAGMNVEYALRITGIITGEADEQKINQLNNIAGIAKIEEQRPYQIVPPDSDIQ